MKLLYTVKKIEEITQFADELDGVIVSNNTISKAVTSSFSLDEMKKAYILAKNNGLEFFILMNKVCFDEDLVYCEQFIQAFKDDDAFFIVGDLGVYGLLKKYSLEHACIFNPDTLICNYQDFNFFASLKMYGAFPSLEIPTKDIQNINDHKRLKLFYKGFGYHPMFYSKRQILKTYKDFTNIKEDLHNKEDLFLQEETRKQTYRILEDDEGSHIFRPHIYSCLEDFNTLKEIDYLIIEGQFIADMSFVIDIFRRAINGEDNKQLNMALQEKYDTASEFMYEDTVYKKVGE